MCQSERDISRDVEFDVAISSFPFKNTTLPNTEERCFCKQGKIFGQGEVKRDGLNVWKAARGADRQEWVIELRHIRWATRKLLTCLNEDHAIYMSKDPKHFHFICSIYQARHTKPLKEALSNVGW